MSLNSRRILAYLIDSFVVGIIIVVTAFSSIGAYFNNNIVYNSFNKAYELKEGAAEGFVTLVTTLCILAVALSVFLKIVLPYLKNGKTIGKAIMKCRIVRLDGHQLTIIDLFKREFLLTYLWSIISLSVVLLSGPQFIASLVKVTDSSDRGTMLEILSTLTSFMSQGFMLLNLIYTLKHTDGEQSVAIHDKFAKTMVVEINNQIPEML